MRLPLLIAGIIGAYVLWPYIEADERLRWAALLPAAYFFGMWALTRSDT
ncbi:MAG: hypothetical protein WBB38_04265 [Hyphomicrobiaceae bacterium]|jgi:hypothetical protein